jgi:hypothetical protein
MSASLSRRARMSSQPAAPSAATATTASAARERRRAPSESGRARCAAARNEASRSLVRPAAGAAEARRARKPWAAPWRPPRAPAAAPARDAFAGRSLRDMPFPAAIGCRTGISFLLAVRVQKPPDAASRPRLPPRASGATFSACWRAVFSATAENAFVQRQHNPRPARSSPPWQSLMFSHGGRRYTKTGARRAARRFRL